MLVGEKGILTCAGWSGMPRLLPMELHRAYKRPPKTHSPRRRASCRLAPGLQGRHTGVQQLRVRRATHRVRPPRHAGAADGQGREVGRRGHEGHQRAGSAAVHRGQLPQGVGAAGLTTSPARRARGREGLAASTFAGAANRSSGGTIFGCAGSRTAFSSARAKIARGAMRPVRVAKGPPHRRQRTNNALTCQSVQALPTNDERLRIRVLRRHATIIGWISRVIGKAERSGLSRVEK